ncbi:DUF1778 domain-containing protein [Mangrovicella endophytica]|uniref:type II toxin-antitoxin system TacA family antitoxin n=1 Tax=Mangrovicella endophytica TaxID=2066697 RepID=UPI000C9E594B|nr:DUF1778 domain-containing protein [Mangrovicella endophytica]
MSLAKKKDNFTARIAPKDLELIKRAAETSGKSVSTFVIEAATRSAEKALMDQRFLHLEGDLFDTISEAISRPARVHPELAELLQNGSEWATSDR